MGKLLTNKQESLIFNKHGWGESGCMRENNLEKFTKLEIHTCKLFQKKFESKSIA